MKIKRFVAQTMRQALAQVRDEQGPDAVILSNRRIDGGIELITAVDYDETLIEEALKRARPESPEPVVVAAPAPEPVRAPPVARVQPPLETRRPAPRVAPPRPQTRANAATPQPAAKATPAPTPAAAKAPATRTPAAAPSSTPAVAPTAADARPRIVWSQDPEAIAMRREVEGLRQLLQGQLASLAWSDRLRREPVRAGVLRDLSRLGLAPDVARALAERVPAAANAGEAFRLPLALLMKHVPTVDDGLLAKGGTFAVVGPTGVGKTTTIAKLAARFALAHGADQVALVSLDHYRIGARDQLLTFARILGVTMHVATNARELGGVLKALADRRLVLIDTAGMSPRDERLASQFATLAAPGSPRPIRTLLTLAANAEHGALDEIARSYAPAKPEAVLLTKLDEAASFGPALSVAIRRALPLAHLCDGQRVPQDVHSAPAKRVWLIRSAVKLAQRTREGMGIDEDYLATHFGKVASHG